MLNYLIYSVTDIDFYSVTLACIQIGMMIFFNGGVNYFCVFFMFCVNSFSFVLIDDNLSH